MLGAELFKRSEQMRNLTIIGCIHTRIVQGTLLDSAGNAKKCCTLIWFGLYNVTHLQTTALWGGIAQNNHWSRKKKHAKQENPAC